MRAVAVLCLAPSPPTLPLYHSMCFAFGVGVESIISVVGVAIFILNMGKEAGQGVEEEDTPEDMKGRSR